MNKQLDPAKALRPLIKSGFWDTLAEVLEQRKSNCIQQLLKCDEKDLKSIQGQVQELDHLLNLPATINATIAPKKS